MTLDELCRAVARLVVENYTFRDMVVELKQQVREKDKKLEELTSPESHQPPS